MSQPIRPTAWTGEPVPKLAPPGAGLPPVELFIVRLLVRWKAGRTSREAASARFASERDAILKLVAGTTTDEEYSRSVLVKRLAGMEDSSRFWSVLMTLDHLRIVNRAITGAILALAAGKVPPGVASTASVKPDRAAGPEVIGEFEVGCSKLERVVASISDLRTSAKYAHPWFGPMDAAGWYFVAGFHMGLHRKQIEHILVNLKSASAA